MSLSALSYLLGAALDAFAREGFNIGVGGDAVS
jgi:hypothetical protein